MNAYPAKDFALYIVWIPMVPTDSAWAADHISGMFSDSRITQFYDPHRRVGLACTHDLFAGCIEKVLAALPQDDEHRLELEGWSTMPMKKRAMWDALFVYGPQEEWNTTVPAPLRWTKQTSFQGPEDGKLPTAEFWRDDCARPPITSDWFLEVRELTSSLENAREQCSTGH